MQIAARLDDYGKPAWIAVMVLGFVLFWPIGLAILGYMIWSGRMGCWKHGRTGRNAGRWHNHHKANWRCGRKDRNETTETNSAFEHYRAETLKRLEDEEREFQDYLVRLREAKDKEEFDRFMTELKSRPAPSAGDEHSGDRAADPGTTPDRRANRPQDIGQPPL